MQMYKSVTSHGYQQQLSWQINYSWAQNSTSENKEHQCHDMNTCSKIRVMNTNISQIQWRDVASLIYISHSQKSNTRQTQNSFKFYEAKMYKKRWKPWHMMSCLMRTSYPSLKTFKKKKRVSNNSCDSLHIHDNSTTNSCEALKTHFTLETR